MQDMLRVRILLRVSSTGQLDADGDLGTQRAIVLNYVKQMADNGWVYDEADPASEYYEGANSGYKNSVEKREVLQRIKRDAKKKQFDILVCYKDDRIGRKSDEVPMYIKELAKYGVEVYTVKDGCITPHNRTEALMTSIRYWHAEGSSEDTGQRVRDTAIENVKKGRNMGGKAPYGYTLEFSGELSKHQRALKKKVKVPERVKIVLKIYDLAITKGYGAFKIAKILNEDEYYRSMAPNGEHWRTGTVGDILKNPIYTGYEAYNRRTHTGESLTRLSREEWVLSEVCNEELKIMEAEYWEKAQVIRKKRKSVIDARVEVHRERGGYVPQSTSGSLPLIDVACCACCGRKLTNGSKYNYWTAKDGEHRKSLVRYYRCQTKHAATPCEGIGNVRADDLEEVVYGFVKEYLGVLEDNSMVLEKVKATRNLERENDKRRLKNLQKKVKDIEEDTKTLQEFLPKVLRGEMPLSIEMFQEQLNGMEVKRKAVLEEMHTLSVKIASTKEAELQTEQLLCQLPTWKDVFDKADYATKQMLVNRLIEKVEVSRDSVKVCVRINLEEFLSRMSGGSPTTPYKHGSG